MNLTQKIGLDTMNAIKTIAKNSNTMIELKERELKLKEYELELKEKELELMRENSLKGGLDYRWGEKENG